LPEVDWAGRYELLRQQTLDHGQTASGWGLALLIHRGVAAWMRACSVMATEPIQPRRTAATASSLAEESARQPFSVLPEVTGQVAHILAEMILETRQEVVT
jgi:hypothetical protein